MTTSTTKKPAAKKPATAKEPQDHKPKADDAVTATVRGVDITVAADTLNDFELLDEIGLADENPAYAPRVLRRVVGEEAFRKLMDAARDKETGKVSLDAGGDVFLEVLGALDPNS